ncbi:hypothetical protein Pelo_979 [Pelomyxa schiedti]|nr:hypothetical protein Pelo_979 [Pelomyxa schiedti]
MLSWGSTYYPSHVEAITHWMKKTGNPLPRYATKDIFAQISPSCSPNQGSSASHYGTTILATPTSQVEDFPQLLSNLKRYHVGNFHKDGIPQGIKTLRIAICGAPVSGKSSLRDFFTTIFEGSTLSQQHGDTFGSYRMVTFLTSDVGISEIKSDELPTATCDGAIYCVNCCLDIDLNPLESFQNWCSKLGINPVYVGTHEDKLWTASKKESTKVALSKQVGATMDHTFLIQASFYFNPGNEIKLRALQILQTVIRECEETLVRRNSVTLTTAPHSNGIQTKEQPDAEMSSENSTPPRISTSTSPSTDPPTNTISPVAPQCNNNPPSLPPQPNPPQPAVQLTVKVTFQGKEIPVQIQASSCVRDVLQQALKWFELVQPPTGPAYYLSDMEDAELDPSDKVAVVGTTSFLLGKY